MSETTIFNRGFQFWCLPITKDCWQFALFVVGHEWWSEDEEYHDAYEQNTWYVQFLFWQISYTREVNYER